jgi:hypothetical protein
MSTSGTGKPKIQPNPDTSLTRLRALRLRNERGSVPEKQNAGSTAFRCDPRCYIHDERPRQPVGRREGEQQMTCAASVRKLFKVVPVVVIVMNPGLVLAQSGSAGGIIGNDEKSLSGSRPELSPDEPGKADNGPAKSEQDSPSAPSRSATSSVSSFDGAWAVVGVGTTCFGSSSSVAVVTSGRLIGQSSRGTVSADGAVHAVGHVNGITIVSTGRFSGRHGAGLFRRSDGCAGRWSASKE